LWVPVPPWAVDVVAVTTQAGTSAWTKERSKDRASLTPLAFLVTEVDMDFIALQFLLTLRQGSFS